MADQGESGAALLGMKDYARAVPLLKQELEKYPSNPRIRLQYAEALAGNGTLDEAVKQYEETAKYYVSHAKDADLNKAMDAASMGMIKRLESEKKIARLDAYGLASVAMDCRVGAISATEKNVHCLLPKSIFVARR